MGLIEEIEKAVEEKGVVVVPVEEKTPGFTPFSEIISDLRPPSWLIDGVLPESGLIEIFGEPASFKSFIALDMAYHIANGLEWHGHDTRRGKVAYIAGEGRIGLGYRALGLQHRYGASLDGLLLSPGPVDLMDEKSMMDLSEMLQQVGGVKLVIIDTLHRNMTGEENSASDFGRILQNIDRHILPHAPAVAWVHHSGHGAKDRSRGTSARFGALDAAFGIERADKEERIVTMKCTKMKEAEEPDPMTFEMEVVSTGRAYDDGRPIDTLVPVLTEKNIRQKDRPLTRRQEDLLRALRIAIRDHGVELSDEIKRREGIIEGKGCTLEEWREEAYKVIDADTTEAKKKAFQRGRKDLIQRDILHFFADTCFVPVDCKVKR